MNPNWKTVVVGNDPESEREWNRWFDRAERPGVYHNPAYLIYVGKYYGKQSELFVFGSKSDFIYYPYWKESVDGLRAAETAGIRGQGYQDIVSSWYYGGPVLKLKNPEFGPALLDRFVTRFHEHCLEQGIVTEFIRFDPGLRNDRLFDGRLPSVFNRETVYVPLDRTMEEIIKGLSSSKRRNIRRAVKEGIEVVPTSHPEDMEKFVRIYRAEMERKKAPPHLMYSKDFIIDLLVDRTDCFTLMKAVRKDEFLGGFMIAHQGTRAHHFLSATDPPYWPLRVNDLLFFNAVMWARDRGYSVFDFQGGRPGVFRFKAGFAPTRGVFKTASVIHNKSVYHGLIRALDSEPGEGDPFPAYRFG